MKEQTQKIQYEITDDYYFTIINDIELNIRAYNKTCISIWIYNHKTDEEIIDEEYSSLKEIQEVLKTKLQLDIELPSIEELLKLQELKGGI